MHAWLMRRAAEAGSSSPTSGIALMQQHHKQTREVSKVRAFHGHGGPIWALHQEHSQLLSGSYDKTIKLWDLGTGRCLRSLRGHTEV